MKTKQNHAAPYWAPTCRSPAASATPFSKAKKSTATRFRFLPSRRASGPANRIAKKRSSSFTPIGRKPASRQSSRTIPTCSTWARRTRHCACARSAAFIDELERCEVLGVSNLIAHPGAHVGAGEVEGIKTIAKSLDEVHKACPGYTRQVTLEITAGQGSNLGYRFEQIGDIIDATQRERPIARLFRHRTRIRRRL